jgi:hypothetical protein
MEPLDIINKLAELTKGVNDVLQDPFFESWALQQQARVEQKIAARPSADISTVYLGFHLQHAQPQDKRREYVHLSENFLLDPPQNVAPHSVFLLLNNDVAKHLPQYMAYYAAHPEALFVIWDWDSQHWIYMSCALALNSDIYIPAASENMHLLSQFNPFTVGPVFVAAHQWSRKFLLEHAELLLTERSSKPLGMHVYYENYPRRNRAIATITNKFDSVGFATNAFKGRSDVDNLKEWAGHKTHWIVPVLAGVPIRVFNALVTGGIPILPAFYRNLPEISILGEEPSYYQVADIVDPQAINSEAVARFDSSGESGLIQRLAHALQHHHVDARCEQILRALEDLMQKAVKRDHSHQLGYLGGRT